LRKQIPYVPELAHKKTADTAVLQELRCSPDHPYYGPYIFIFENVDIFIFQKIHTYLFRPRAIGVGLLALRRFLVADPFFFSFFRNRTSPMSDVTEGAIGLGTNPAEPTGECGLRIFKHPSGPTTTPPSPQYGKAEASEYVVPLVD